MARILAVDDDDSVLGFLEVALALEGHDVVRATNGRQALELARTCEPAAVILDVMMPEIDGLTAARMLRADPALATIPVIMLTARADDGEIWEGWTAGIDSFLSKPVDIDLLFDELERVGVPREPVPTTWLPE